MKILTIHNKYKFRGGEDESRESEDAVLTSQGHEVEQLIFDNKSIQGAGTLWAGIGTPWSFASYRQVARKIIECKPDIVDIHNFFPLASPSVHHAAHRLGVPVIQTLHNYRLLCPSGNFYRAGVICEDCAGHSIPWQGVLHRCYRDSTMQSAAVASMIMTHRLIGTWKRTVTTFVCVSEFERQKFIENGFPPARLVTKPNFVLNDPTPGAGGTELLYVGRLSIEKGIRTMLRAMELVSPSARLAIVGDGPLAPEVEAAADRNPRLRYLGRLPLKQVSQLMGASRCLLFPSEWYETFGRVAAESFSAGTPVIAAKLGAIGEIVEHGRTGFHFRAGDPQDLARAIDYAVANGDALAGMRKEARLEYERKYTAERNYQMLLEIYHNAISKTRARDYSLSRPQSLGFK